MWHATYLYIKHIVRAFGGNPPILNSRSSVANKWSASMLDFTICLCARSCLMLSVQNTGTALHEAHCCAFSLAYDVYMQHLVQWTLTDEAIKHYYFDYSQSNRRVCTNKELCSSSRVSILKHLLESASADKSGVRTHESLEPTFLRDHSTKDNGTNMTKTQQVRQSPDTMQRARHSKVYVSAREWSCEHCLTAC